MAFKDKEKERAYKKAYDWLCEDNIFSESENGYETYEQALEKGLQEALKLI